jgi:hypothetical protein
VLDTRPSVSAFDTSDMDTAPLGAVSCYLLSDIGKHEQFSQAENTRIVKKEGICKGLTELPIIVDPSSTTYQEMGHR